MEFSYDARTEELRERLLRFMDDHVYPAEPVFAQQREETAGGAHWAPPPIVEELKAEARRQGLWNLFLPGERGAGLTNLQYAPLAEITGRSPHLAPPALNCAAPDTGNMEVLNEFGSDEQRTTWLEPLLAGEIRSAFAMTEPDVASSDATNIETRVERDGEEYVITGRKWYISGAMNPNCRIFIVMGKTDPSADRHRQQSMVLVPRDTPGVDVRRGMRVFGYDDGDHGGHAEVVFDGVRVPVANLVGEEGGGFAIAQARLGPGRIHHCMRTIGVAERALALLIDRAVDRQTFGSRVVDKGLIQDWIAESRIEIDMAREYVLHTAHVMDTEGNKAAASQIAGIKVAVPNIALKVLDRAIQVHGAAGVTQFTPLAAMYAHVRTLRIADGPDEVHKMTIARREIRRRDATFGSG
jgi:acyl-CoA dehydrogenase